MVVKKKNDVTSSFLCAGEQSITIKEIHWKRSAKLQDGIKNNNNNKQATNQTKPVSVKFSKYFVQENFKKNKLSSFICVQTKSFQTTWALVFPYIHPIELQSWVSARKCLYFIFLHFLKYIPGHIDHLSIHFQLYI